MEKNKGYTLVELVVVIAILGIISTICIPMFYSSPEKKMRNIQRMLVRDLRWAQEMAMYDKKTIYVNFLKDKYIVRISPTKPPILRRDLPRNIAVDTNFPGEEIIYSPEGSPSKGGTVYLYEGSSVKEVTILPATGRPKYYE